MTGDSTKKSWCIYASGVTVNVLPAISQFFFWLLTTSLDFYYIFLLATTMTTAITTTRHHHCVLLHVVSVHTHIFSNSITTRVSFLSLRVFLDPYYIY
jgi:hypothetical protein